MRIWAISILMAAALAACSAEKSETGAPLEPPPAAEAPAQTAPVDDPAMEPPAEQPTLAPEPEVGSPAPEAPPPPAPPPPPPPAAPAEPPPPGAAEAPVTRSLARRAPVATPVIVEIDRTQERRPANGGSAVVLFSDAASTASRNTATCDVIWRLMDTATTQEVRVGIRKASDGTTEALRPMYWLNRNAAPAGARTCAQRMANYDYARAKTIRDKYGLPNNGPYFIVARTDERAAAVIDLTGKSNAEVAALVEYFRDGFAFQNDIWDPSRNDPAKKRAVLTSFFGSRFQESFMNALGFVSNPAARAGCRQGDLRDAPCT